ncbi:flagellar biosynthesis regulator FlaF [Magnetospira sp. QH-2]|uniref:flagellar biosynthesis regulator FlaF n=1 Tax=Magnetospira sp. (strain QH-2) TaxID=1288970 RepID=UPI0003E8168B|nr:flagellar biosynthesis regulator FlaF [Magnetospira sp. QH-2]CCQ74174.1 putative flagellar biosynthesis regulatory protein FlaF [Magnetospira sp. QH-2]
MYKKNLVASYEKAPTPGNPQATEAWALAQAGIRLTRAKESGSIEDMQAALRLNWQLWTIFQSELLSPNCTVPDDVRSSVLSLANFVDKHTLEIMPSPTKEKIDVLININRELSGGLNAGLEGAPDPAETGNEPSSSDGGVSA